MNKIQMVDLKGQYDRLKNEIDQGIHEVLDSSQFIGGPVVEQFERSLADYLDCKHVMSCANGTDALQIALMSLGLQAGDEVIIPSFTYISTAEVVALLGLTPVMVDVNEHHFNCTAKTIETAITPKTKAIVPVHLFGQSCPMEEIMVLAQKHQLYVIEDNAQSIGATYHFKNGTSKKTGTIGHIGCTSFFPSKNLGAFGDGGAINTNDDKLAEKIRMIANHGQRIKYHHDVIGCNSRLDAIQAAVLNVKLRHLGDFVQRRKAAAAKYHELLTNIESITLPKAESWCDHVFHQYTIRVIHGHRDGLKEHLASAGISSTVYYPIPLYKQKAFADLGAYSHHNTEQLCHTVLSLPMHTELTSHIQQKVVNEINAYFHKV